MPPELVDEDGVTAFIRIDGPDDTRGKAKAVFASQWGVDFTEIRVSMCWFAPPDPECDECAAKATCGIAAKWRDGGPSFKEKTCEAWNPSKRGLPEHAETESAERSPDPRRHP
jgi:hypothetical protein